MITLKGGLTGIFLGPPNTGKSTLLGTATEVEGIDKALLLAPKPREVNSFKYAQHRDTIDTEEFHDPMWAPAIDSYGSGAFTELYKRVLSLYEDTTYDAVLLDPMTDVTYLAAHELLEPEKAETPRDLRDSIGFYGALKYKLKGFTQSLTGLASASLERPKHVFVAVHAQPTKEEDIKGKATAESQARGVEFMGDVLPMIEGGYRREIAAEFDVVGFSSLRHESVRVGNKMVRESKYVVQLNADPERHAKAAIVPRLENAEISNSLVDLFRVISEASNA